MPLDNALDTRICPSMPLATSPVGHLPHRVRAMPVRDAHASAAGRRDPLAARLFEIEHPEELVDAAPLRRRALAAA